MTYKATWIDAGHSLHHEAETADAIIVWSESMLRGQIGVVWVTIPDAGEKVTLVEFKRRLAANA